MRAEKDGVTYGTGKNNQATETMGFALFVLYLESLAFICAVHFCWTWLCAGAVAFQKNLCITIKSRRPSLWVPTAFLIIPVGKLVPLLLFPGLSIF